MRTLKTILWVLVFFPIIHANAQSVSGGITAGLSLNSTNLVSVYEEPQEHMSLQNMTGVEAGIYTKFKFGFLYVRPMAVASFLHGTVTSTVAETETEKESGFNLTTIEVPVLGGLDILGVVGLEAGPSWNYIASYTSSVEGTSLGLSRHALGYRAGVRVTLSRVGLFAHYGGILNKRRGETVDLERPSRMIFGVTLDLAGK